jgi:hypothetical protein
MEGLVVWIIIIVISSLIKNANKNKKIQNKPNIPVKNYDEEVYDIKPVKSLFNDIVDYLDTNEDYRDVIEEPIAEEPIKENVKEKIIQSDFNNLKDKNINDGIQEIGDIYLNKNEKDVKFNINLSKKALVNGVILSEILKRPKRF